VVLLAGLHIVMISAAIGSVAQSLSTWTGQHEHEHISIKSKCSRS
jgi:hypothetical protein